MANINVIEVIQVMKNDLANHNRGITLLLQTLTRMQGEQAKMSNMLALMEQKLPPHVLIDLDAAAAKVSPVAASKAGEIAPIQPEDLNVPVAELQKEQQFEKIAEEQAAILATLQPTQPGPVPTVEEVNPTPAPAPTLMAPDNTDIQERTAAIMELIGPNNFFVRAFGPAVKVGGIGNLETKLTNYSNDIATTEVSTVVRWPAGIYKSAANQAPQIYLKGTTLGVIVDNSLEFNPGKIVIVDLQNATLLPMLRASAGVVNQLYTELSELL